MEMAKNIIKKVGSPEYVSCSTRVISEVLRTIEEVRLSKKEDRKVDELKMISLKCAEKAAGMVTYGIELPSVTKIVKDSVRMGDVQTNLKITKDKNGIYVEDIITPMSLNIYEERK